MKKLLLAALVGCSFNAAAADISFESGIDVLALNGKSVQNADSIELPAGENQIVIEYSKALKSGSSKKTYTSKPYVVSIHVANELDSYKLGIETYRTYELAKVKFDAGNVEWQVSNNGSPTEYDLELLPGVPGLLPYANIEEAIRLYNKNNGIVLTSSGAMNINEAAVSVAKDGKITVTGDAVTQLKLWYTKASKEERKEFRRWMIDQD
ncbi:YccT family protein [Vibrio sp. LaRot3]|uniref:YccT family protein n=1 Tax=Vibrio sp. LaRot3 TaxID=2998829 RepID=UPI0022CDE88E|nr:DUF2057 domain-containing protein [Vibrio sp. LaRot3]MDA0147272.1 DUF2057 domain-containing protein [Vibrio sp. LaRot3]